MLSCQWRPVAAAPVGNPNIMRYQFKLSHQCGTQLTGVVFWEVAELGDALLGWGSGIACRAHMW